VLDDEPKMLGTKKVMEVYQRVAPEGTDAQELAKESLFKMGKLG
jgi:hypothetical protein